MYISLIYQTETITIKTKQNDNRKTFRTFKKRNRIK